MYLVLLPQRGQFGEERYEKAEFQRTVRATFLALMEEDKVRGTIKKCYHISVVVFMSPLALIEEHALRL